MLGGSFRRMEGCMLSQREDINCDTHVQQMKDNRAVLIRSVVFCLPRDVEMWKFSWQLSFGRVPLSFYMSLKGRTAHRNTDTSRYSKNTDSQRVKQVKGTAVWLVNFGVLRETGCRFSGMRESAQHKQQKWQKLDDPPLSVQIFCSLFSTTRPQQHIELFQKFQVFESAKLGFKVYIDIVAGQQRVQRRREVAGLLSHAKYCSEGLSNYETHRMTCVQPCYIRKSINRYDTEEPHTSIASLSTSH